MSSENINEHHGLVKQVREMLDKVELPENSIVHEQCIYRVPHKIRQPNQQAYTPRVVSIGPIHTPFRLVVTLGLNQWKTSNCSISRASSLGLS